MIIVFVFAFIFLYLIIGSIFLEILYRHLNNQSFIEDWTLDRDDVIPILIFPLILIGFLARYIILIICTKVIDKWFPLK